MFYPMNFIHKCRPPGILLLMLLWLAWGAEVRAQENATLEYQVKAAFLYNFGKFVSWPDTNFDRPDAPLVIGVLGGNPFHDDLKNMIVDKTINGHPVIFRMVTALAGAKNCHILFISASVQNDAANILGALHGANVLTVTENMTHFAQSGYAINFVTEQDKIRFEINGAAAAQAGLTVSSKLMSLAKPLEK
jgi:hypothetical protein